MVRGPVLSRAMASAVLEGEGYDDGDDDVFYTIDKKSPSLHSGRNGLQEKVRTINRYGFILDSHKSTTTTDVPDTVPKKVHLSRERKWLDMLSNWNYWMSKRFTKVRDRCRKGIPDSVRARAWQYLSCSMQFQKDSSKTYQHGRTHISDLYNEYADSFTHHLQIYLKQTIDSKADTEIKNDLHRSFPTHCMFVDDGGSGQQNLYRVLRAYTAYNPSEGFCQAHAPIVSVLLMHMAEEQAFWCLVAMLDKYMPGYYSGQLEEVGNDGVILLNLLRVVHPKLHKRMKEANIEAPLFMVEWFMCLFSRDLPWPSVLRIWDIFFCEGVKILFRIALVLLKHCTAHLDKIPRELYELLSCLKIKNMPPQILQPDFLIREAYNLPIKDSDMIREHKRLVKLKAKGTKGRTKPRHS